MSTKTYVIMEERNVTEIVIMRSLNKEDTYRRSLDGTQSLFKFKDRHPNCCKGDVKYTHAEILVILEDLKWTSETT